MRTRFGAFFALNPDTSAVRFHLQAAKGQPQPRPAHLLPAHLTALFEDALKIGGWNARITVLHLYHQIVSWIVEYHMHR